MKSLKHIKKLSTLLKLSMEDAAKAARSKKYVFAMSSWHRPMSGGRCAICQAGATMAVRLKVDPKQEIDWRDIEMDLEFGPFDTPTRHRLSALDSLRVGDVGEAYESMFFRPLSAKKLQMFGEPSFCYGDSYTAKYRAAMRRLIKDLKRAGL